MSETLFFKLAKAMPQVEGLRPRIVKMTGGVNPLYSTTTKFGFETVD